MRGMIVVTTKSGC